LVGLRSSGTCLHPAFIVRLWNHLHMLANVPQSLDMKTQLEWKSCGQQNFPSHDSLIMFYQTFHITE
jgi:hypothetical protein